MEKKRKTETTQKACFGRTLEQPFEPALERVVRELADQGFGVLTRIDVRETLKSKLGVTVPRQEILGACNPPLAHRALEAVPEIGVLLPCNVVLRELSPSSTRVEVVNARAMAETFPGRGLEEIADEVQRRLNKVLAAL